MTKLTITTTIQPRTTQKPKQPCWKPLAYKEMKLKTGLGDFYAIQPGNGLAYSTAPRACTGLFFEGCFCFITLVSKTGKNLTSSTHLMGIVGQVNVQITYITTSQHGAHKTLGTA